MSAENFVPTHKVGNMIMEKVILGVPETVFVPLSGSCNIDVFKRGGGGVRLKRRGALRMYHMMSEEAIASTL